MNYITNANGIWLMLIMSILGGLFLRPSTPTERFLEEYPESAEVFRRLENGPLRTRVKCTYGSRGTIEVEAFYWHGLARKEMSIGDRQHVICVSENLAFSASKESEAEFWTLERADKRNSSEWQEIPLRNIDGENRETLLYFRPHYVIGSKPLIDIIEDPTCSLISAKDVVVDGTQCIEIEIEQTPDEGDKFKRFISLDPANGWRITREIITGGAGIERNISYSENGNLPSKVSMAIGGRMHRSFEFLEWDESPIDSSRFYPAFYGFPDMSPSPPSSSWRTMTGLLVLGVIAVVFTISRIKRRSKT